MVVVADAVADPGTVVVEFEDAGIADRAVVGSRRSGPSAFVAFRVFRRERRIPRVYKHTHKEVEEHAAG